MSHLSRRDVLRAAAAAPFLLGRSSAQPEPTAGGMIVRMHEPQNLEMPFHTLPDWKVPTERFYVRSHFAAPRVNPGRYELSVEGHVEKPFTLTIDELKALPATTRPLTLECAGNSRVFLVPPARGVQWSNGAVGNADWTGVPLSTLLERAKPKAGAIDVVLVGADSGTIADPATPGAIHFDRSLPLAKAMKPEVLIAHGMNGANLTAAHGFPVRAVVGGWYGMASVKWLTRIVVTDRPHTGFFQTLDYSYFVRTPAGPVLTPVREVQPKAAIARPGVHEVVPFGKPYTVAGAAWAGENKVAKVEVSTDGGATWNPAKIDGEAKPFCWVTWRYDWTPRDLGTAALVARCTDAAGATQPEKRDPDRRTYMINHLVPVEVLVR
jgi:DMSO/TMAO reductase YedYZ molybdopterin-dependent catalytic subunit